MVSPIYIPDSPLARISPRSPHFFPLKSPLPSPFVFKTPVKSPESSPRSPVPISIGNLWCLLPFLVTALHVLLAPHTKVEETPGLHAVHDLLKYGVNQIDKYDHVTYPGPVARSMIPSIILSAAAYPLSLLTGIDEGPHLQILIRLVQSAMFSAAVVHLSRSIGMYYKSPLTSRLFLLFSMTQFHVPFYAGRTLPNFMALPFVLWGCSYVIRPQQSARGVMQGICLSTLTATISRLELAPLAIALAGISVLQGRVSFTRGLLSGAAGGFLGLALTNSVDTYFFAPISHLYPYYQWPELSAAVFNIVQGKSADWGVMPGWYYLAALVKLGMGAVPFWGCGVYMGLRGERVERRMVQLVLGCLIASVGCLSLVGHKEWRFIIYSIPLLNILAARAAATLWHAYISSRYLKLKSQKIQAHLCKTIIILTILANVFLTIIFTSISRLNYPGATVGKILVELAHQNQSSTEVHKVYLSASALHSGATLLTLPSSFLSTALGLQLDHPESAYERCSSPWGNSPQELWDGGYMWVVGDEWEEFERSGGWEVVGEIEGFAGVGRGGIVSGRRLAVLQRTEV
ncbi:hypothetical protein L202_05997 [Cryptococcus amylolentus CBS 6039]|uniref:Mannosyltransferase n=1 Tax=Cryptococcus amylolentus CBS 6039 TaxID=1295533 RepID=A0A1E3HI72_9TREE|nr:hypothetical protein L202_05997 [Cryptococcus amylolentus CBS 6039]ODN76052.1 hypothetical protein L202_05997 [Cryptococcus amylolentus CBS 6039]